MADPLQQYIYDTIVTQDDGTLGSFVDPTPPTDLGSALTQPQIDFLKTLINEIQNRFVGGL